MGDFGAPNYWGELNWRGADLKGVYIYSIYGYISKIHDIFMNKKTFEKQRNINNYVVTMV